MAGAAIGGLIALEALIGAVLAAPCCRLIQGADCCDSNSQGATSPVIQNLPKEDLNNCR